MPSSGWPSIPARLHGQRRPQVFDPVYMKDLYEVGFEMGRIGDPWMRVPPEDAGSVASR